MEFNRLVLNNDIDYINITTTKFKTNLIGISFLLPLNNPYLYQLVLLSQILIKTSASYPKEKLLSKKLNTLYDTQIFTNIDKRGKMFQMTFYLHYVSNKFIPKNILDEVSTLFKECLLDNSNITYEAVEKEKRLYKELIEAKSNNHTYLVIKKLYNEMFKGEDYLLMLDPELDLINQITYEEVLEAYDYLFKSAYVFTFNVGDEPKEKVLELFNSFNLKSGTMPLIKDQDDYLIKDKPSIFSVKNEAKQSFIAMGFRIDIHFDHPLYHSMFVLNKLLGGYFNSVLMQIIREKYGLVYYINSEYDWYKGFGLITAGASFENVDKTIKIINDIIDELKQGKYFDEYFEITKNQIINDQLDMDDSLLSLIERINRIIYLNQKEGQIDKKINKIMNLKTEDIIKCFEFIKLDTIVFLDTGEQNDY